MELRKSCKKPFYEGDDIARCLNPLSKNTPTCLQIMKISIYKIK